MTSLVTCLRKGRNAGAVVQHLTASSHFPTDELWYFARISRGCLLSSDPTKVRSNDTVSYLILQTIETYFPSIVSSRLLTRRDDSFRRCIDPMALQFGLGASRPLDDLRKPSPVSNESGKEGGGV